MTIATIPMPKADEALPPLTYRDLALALERVSASEKHTIMVPYLVSALRAQARFLTGEMIMFEILRASNCIADIPTPGDG